MVLVPLVVLVVSAAAVTAARCLRYATASSIFWKRLRLLKLILGSIPGTVYRRPVMLGAEKVVEPAFVAKDSPVGVYFER